MLGEVSALRQQQAAVEAELAEKQARAGRGDREARSRQAPPGARSARGCSGRSTCCATAWSRSTRPARPDMVNVVLESASWSEVSARADYLSQIQDYDDAVADRVKGLRDEATRRGRADDGASACRSKEARDAIAAKEREVAAARAAAEARFAELKAAQAARQAALEALESRSQALSDNLASISEQIAADGGAAPPARRRRRSPPARAPTTSPKARRASRPRAPPAVQAAIEAANAIATTPYIWGGGHGSFESSGYDCSGAVSYALHGGGFLESPLDSTGLETWGEPGPGQWITVYANAGHAWMIIAGLAFDTVGGPGPRWHRPRSTRPKASSPATRPATRPPPRRPPGPLGSTAS